MLTNLAGKVVESTFEKSSEVEGFCKSCTDFRESEFKDAISSSQNPGGMV